MLIFGARDEAPTLSINLQVCGTRRPQRRLSIELNASPDIFSYKLVTLKTSLCSILACNGLYSKPAPCLSLSLPDWIEFQKGKMILSIF